MSAAKHTPAPWRAAYDGHGGMSVECDEGQIGFVSNRRAQEANACLIAAAPELLDALVQLECKALLGAKACDAQGPAEGFRVLAEFARAAIAKAEVQS